MPLRAITNECLNHKLAYVLISPMLCLALHAKNGGIRDVHI